MLPIFLIICLTSVIIVGFFSTVYVARKQMVACLLLAVSFACVLLLLGAALVGEISAENSMNGHVKRFISALTNQPLSSATGDLSLDVIIPIYVSIFGYSILTVIVLLLTNFTIAASQTIIFLVMAPMFYTYYRNYLTLSAMITLGVLIAASIISLVRLVASLSYLKGSRMARISRSDRALGSDTLTHLAYYLSILSLMASSGFCFELTPFVEMLSLAFISTAAGTVGIIAETNNFKITLKERIE